MLNWRIESDVLDCNISQLSQGITKNLLPMPKKERDREREGTYQHWQWKMVMLFNIITNEISRWGCDRTLGGSESIDDSHHGNEFCYHFIIARPNIVSNAKWLSHFRTNYLPERLSAVCNHHFEWMINRFVAEAKALSKIYVTSPPPLCHSRPVRMWRVFHLVAFANWKNDSAVFADRSFEDETKIMKIIQNYYHNECFRWNILRPLPTKNTPPQTNQLSESNAWRSHAQRHVLRGVSQLIHLH